MNLSKKIIAEDRLPREIKLIAGVDAAYIGDIAIGSVSVLDYPSFVTEESETAVARVKVPYFPTLLAFREIPPTTACIRKLKINPDVFLVDGQGIAHPYYCGFASHLGIAIGKPTIGVAKNKLVGEPITENENTFLTYNGRIVGAVVKTKDNSKPIYVSVGHLVSLRTAIEIVKKSIRGNRIPEPLRQAHTTASEQKEQLKRKLAHKI